MKDIHYVLQNFFTHKDFLVPASQIPGTLFTPLHFLFETILVIFLIGAAIWLSRRKQWIRPVFTGLWIILLVWEVGIIWWDSTACQNPGLDLTVNLSLYPCSIFMLALPLVIWGKGFWQYAACGYIFTLGLLGALINFLYPFSKLLDYSCLSFIAFHTFFYHGSMLFVFLVMLLAHMHDYRNVQHWQQLLMPSLLSLLVSVPANVVNYTIGADYMYFRGKIFLLTPIFGSTPEPVITLTLYLLYIAVPALFYLPSYLSRHRFSDMEAELEDELFSGIPEVEFSWLFTK